MPGEVEEILRAVKAFRGRLKGRSTERVNDRGTKDEAIRLATGYFSTYRARIVGAVGESEEIRTHDKRWHELVRLAHGNRQRNRYLKTVGVIREELTEFSIRVLAASAEAGGRAGGMSDLNPGERNLVATLDALLPTAGASYRQGLLDLLGVGRLSYRGTACEFREALRETLDHLAPDSEVMKENGFKLEDGQKKPTMRQKVRFVLLSRGRKYTQAAGAEKAVDVVEGLVGGVVRATYNRASLASHVESTRGEVLRMKRYIDTVLFDLLEVPEVSKAP